MRAPVMRRKSAVMGHAALATVVALAGAGAALASRPDTDATNDVCPVEDHRQQGPRVVLDATEHWRVSLSEPALEAAPLASMDEPVSAAENEPTRPPVVKNLRRADSGPR